MLECQVDNHMIGQKMYINFMTYANTRADKDKNLQTLAEVETSICPKTQKQNQ